MDNHANKLTKREKSRIRKGLMRFSRAPNWIDSFRHFSLTFTNPARAIRNFGLALMLILPTAGFITAAENSLPNHGIIYDFKVGVLESTQSAFQKEAEDKAQFAVNQTKTRRQEAVTLVKKGKLDDNAAIKLKENLEKHTRTAINESQEVAKTSPQKSLAIQSKLEDSLTISSKVLSKTESGLENKVPLQKLVSASRNQATQVKAVSLATESLLTPYEVYSIREELVFSELQEVSDNVRQLIVALEATRETKEKDDNVALQAIEDAQIDNATIGALEVLESSTEAMLNAATQVESGNFKEALSELRSSSQDTQAAISILESK